MGPLRTAFCVTRPCVLRHAALRPAHHQVQFSFARCCSICMAQVHLPESIKDKVLERETTVYCSIFSQDGEYLVCGSSFGKICVWQLSIFLSTKNWEQNKSQNKVPTPQLSFQAHAGPIYSIIIADSVLVSGGDEEIKVWKWIDLLSALQKGPQIPLLPIHELKTKQNIYSRGSLSMYAETNGLAYDNKKKYILGACGDNKCYLWDLNNFQLVSTLQSNESAHGQGHGPGPAGYLHAVVALPNSQQAATASEDGTVNIWDTNTSKLIGTLPVSIGRWVGAMALDSTETWLMCGGGSKELVQYYLPTRSKSWGVATSGYIQSILFADNKVMSAGNEPYIYHYSFGGDLIKKVHTSIPSVFSVGVNRNSRKNQVLIATGSSPTIDLYAPEYGNVTTSLCFR